jgi:hypothetical protein
VIEGEGVRGRSKLNIYSRKLVQSRMEGKESTISSDKTQRLTRAMLDEALVWLQVSVNGIISQLL